MRIGFLTSTDVSNVNYRCIGPAEALGSQGHQAEVVVQHPNHTFDPHPLRRCEVVHIYRRADPYVRACVDDLRNRGIAITWDNDDDIRLVPPKSLKHLGIDAVGAQRDFRDQSKLIRQADLVTTTSSLLAERFRQAGAAKVTEIENYVLDWQFAAPLRSAGAFVIGWVAGLEHHADAEVLGISTVLRRIMERNAKVRVVTIGVRLDLDLGRYEHESFVPIQDLPERVRRFDVAIAPLGDIPMSYARSNIKPKEYAAAGVPWLASARGPYLGLGAREGGLLVDDGNWEQALQAMIDSRLKRTRMRRRARAWARSQALDRNAHRWLSAFEEAVERAAARRSLETRPKKAVGRASGAGRN